MSQEKRIVKVGLHTLDKPMTREQAMRYGIRRMPPDLKRTGFECVVARSDTDMHGGLWFRINYGKRTHT